MKKKEYHGSGKHGRARTPEYQAWGDMNARCERPSHASFKYYGARGISVCARWRSSYAAFIEDVGSRPAPRMSLDRVNNDGNYEPGNVRWATKAQQNSNRRDNRFVDVCGVRQTLAEASRKYGVDRKTALGRMGRGLTAEQAFAVGVSQ